MHLTTRGRRAVRLLRTALCALAIIGGTLFFSAQTFTAEAVAGDEVVGVAADAVVVGEGESLWTVASNLGLDRDTRDVVADIVELNHLSSPVVHPGQSLDVPQR
ncbi:MULTISPECIES: LysM peptidoglycan-binding domain-containing protein [Brevibacterium]|nr:LysM peptidoglycan-binding domain-containing protein [Brevibacterium casei]MCT1766961.1 LysM peptidoglycan-binding domain-containing protein [Brevibacterium casei]MCT2358951.1 LysM peptidoglycan-binding domain-containing protein [Brevibacterium casei]